MKKSFFYSLSVLFLMNLSCKKAESNGSISKITEIKFDETVHDFGTINQGDKVNYTFKFTNVGDEDFIISNAVGSCGCTVAEYTKDPTKPGQTGEIKVVFNSAGKSGQQSKTVTLTTNTKTGTEKLEIKASINVPASIAQDAKPLTNSK
jgi:Protein of unknown function (DUF1573)